ncbi:hypothetical protein SO694_00081050 [Aureococcus anophagefferens]|uniref:Uncharacterized protein n=1 Tax=Aureococcus anophagefferens TaxID=44056 RepID=A0ABR1G5B2_AURAN
MDVQTMEPKAPALANATNASPAAAPAAQKAPPASPAAPEPAPAPAVDAGAPEEAPLFAVKELVEVSRRKFPAPAQQRRRRARAAPPSEEPADAAWLRGVLATAPRDVPDELDLEAFHAARRASSPPAAASRARRRRRACGAGARSLARLEADNHVMVVDGTLFLV